jgi:hypothetical protein
MKISSLLAASFPSLSAKLSLLLAVPLSFGIRLLPDTRGEVTVAIPGSIFVKNAIK